MNPTATDEASQEDMAGTVLNVRLTWKLAAILAAWVISGSLIAAYATDYEDIVVTYEDGTVDVYTFEGCVDVYGTESGRQRPYWVLRGVLWFVSGRILPWYFRKDTCCEWTYFITRVLNCDGIGQIGSYYDFIEGECYVAGTGPCEGTYDDLSEVVWDFEWSEVPPVKSITGGDFISGERCCACSTSITSAPVTTAAVGAMYEYVATSSVADECVVASIENPPSWAAFAHVRWSGEAARLYGTPTCGDLGLHPGIVITVTDDNGDSDSVEFSITVTDQTTISGCPDDILVERPKDGSSAIATWIEPTWCNVCGVQSFISTHMPGDEFPLGTTTVTYTATGPDNVAACSFDVVVVYHSADINRDGRVDVLDVRLCYQMVLGVREGTSIERQAADVDDDGDIDMDDANALAEYVIGMRDTLP